ncbi:hypothetical protein [Flexivirga sp. B27]
MRTVTRISQLSVAAALGLTLAACGSSSSNGGSGSPSDTPKQSAATSGPAQSGSIASGEPTPGSGSSGESSQSSAATSDSSNQAGVPDGKTLMHQSRAAYRKAKSAHLHARIKQDAGFETVDIKGTVDGSNQEATIAQEGQGSATFRTVSNKTYVKANKQFWTTAGKVQPTIAAKVADKWVIAPPSTKAKLSSVTIKSFLDSVLGEDNISDSDLEKSKTEKSSYKGKDVYVLTDEGSDGGSVTFAADSKDFLRLLPPADQSDEGEVTADGWNTQPSVSAPAGAIDPKTVK